MADIRITVAGRESYGYQFRVELLTEAAKKYWGAEDVETTICTDPDEPNDPTFTRSIREAEAAGLSVEFCP